MSLFTTCLLVFFSMYWLTGYYISVLYHRALAHGAVRLAPWMRGWVVVTGSWVTGVDPKVWVCMHRLHHLHSDTKLDPHSPWHQGRWGLIVGQSRSYGSVLVRLQNPTDSYSQLVSDLDFPVCWSNRKGMWYLPYVGQTLLAVIIGVLSGHLWYGFAYWAGSMSHPLQGWMVNAFGHSAGYRNFNTADRSTNNTPVAWLVMGEGFQNNHHAFPKSAKFSVRPMEFDLGYLLCRISQSIGLLKIERLPAEVRKGKPEQSEAA